MSAHRAGIDKFSERTRTKRDETSGYQSIYDCAALAHRAGHSVSVPVAGSSMSPFLAGGRDTVFFSRPDTPLRRGDIVFYERASGQFVMHRIRRVHRDGSLRHPWRCADRDRDRHPAAAGLCAGDRRLPKGSAASARRFSVGALSRTVAVGHSAAAPHRPGMVRIQKAPDIIQLQYKITDCRKEKRSGFHFAFFILLGFRGCLARGALRRTHGRPA